jgi:hypothetical protein
MNSKLENIPYKISQSFLQFETILKFVKSLDGVKMYELKDNNQAHFLSLNVAKTTLYFYNNELVAVYYLLNERSEQLLKVIDQVESELNLKVQKIDEIKYFWNLKNEKFLIGISGNQIIYIYQISDTIKIQE